MRPWLPQQRCSALVGRFFYDFAAAFPSVSQAFLLDYARHSGLLPSHMVNFVQHLYRQNRCQIAMGGERYDGFNQTAGIRQGCPLSPLLFTLSADLLLKRMNRLLPGAVLRAYADDVAMVVPDVEEALEVLEEIFDEYAALSGLRLHHGKSVQVPLFQYEEQALRDRIMAVAPGWADFTIRHSAKYLGVYMGPGKGTLSWTKPMQKFLDRASIWRQIDGGMLLTILAYKAYVFPVLPFVCQFEPPPPDWSATERRACQLLFRGPTGWLTPPCLRGLCALGFPAELPDLATYAMAT